MGVFTHLDVIEMEKTNLPTVKKRSGNMVIEIRKVQPIIIGSFHIVQIQFDIADTS